MGLLAFNLLVLFLTALVAFYKWSTRNLNYWKIRKIPHIKSAPVVGNYWELLLGKVNVAEKYREFYHQMKDVKYFGILIGTYPALLIKDPKLIMRILVKDFRYFYDRGFHVSDSDVLGTNLFFLRNPKWKLLRNKTVSVFSSAKLKSSFDILDKCLDDLIDYLNENAHKKEWPTRQLMGDAMTDIVCKAICGLEIHSIKNPSREHVAMQNMAFASSFRGFARNTINFISPYLAKKVHIFPRILHTYFDDLTWKTIEMRKEKNIRRSDLLQLLLEVYEQEQMLPAENRVLSRELFVSNIFIMILAGYETSTTTSSLTLHELAHHPDIQDKVRQEIKQVTRESGGKITYDSLKKMKFLDQVLSETLRIYPLANMIFRECMEEYNIPGTDHVIEKGVFVQLPTLALHTDPALWKDPETYNPDRFSEENSASIIPGSYLPFGDGPRICIGKRFALLQLKLVLSKILLHYEVSPCEKTRRHNPLTKNSLLSVPEGVFWLNFTKVMQ
ncbi:hypothetical protein M8J76_004777 [Diaphorina citri]|nr:hypothetical protein M8J75_005638 [Diaphorina citri]KAI5740524.1 hypothetical protein M8J76_004777 [Diaphorina citri]